MVLLFLGVIFLLLGWQALDSSGKSDDDSAAVTTVSTTAGPASSTSGKPPAPNEAAEVRVYNVSSKEGIAKSTGDELKAAGFKVTEVTNLSVPDISATTVYYGEESERPRRKPWARSWECRSKSAFPHLPIRRQASSFW